MLQASINAFIFQDPQVTTLGHHDLPLTEPHRLADFDVTSLPFVSTAGRGAVLSGTAPAFLRLIAQPSDGLHSVADVVGDGAAEAHEVVDADEQSVRGDLVLMLFQPSGIPRSPLT